MVVVVGDAFFVGVVIVPFVVRALVRALVVDRVHVIITCLVLNLVVIAMLLFYLRVLFVFL